MSTLHLTPAGRLQIHLESSASPALHRIAETFGDSLVAGLAALLEMGEGELLSDELRFWRSLAHQAVTLWLRGQGTGEVAAKNLFGESAEEAKQDVGLNAWISAWIESAPPFQGLEYLTVPFVRQSLTDFREWLDARAKADAEGLSGWLAKLPGQWHMVGRVTFHLAENKRDPEQPFAFLATYVNRVSQAAKPQHLPLGQALKQYAGEGNHSQLMKLLTPVRDAAAKSPFCKRLLDSRAIFQPQAWSIREAHEFLKAVPEMEAAGLIVRIPDWWNRQRPPRPQVQMQIGSKVKQAPGEPNWLDFSVAMAMDGEPLTAAEQAAILASTEGLMKLRGKWVQVDSTRLQEALQQWQELEAEHAQGIDFISGMRMLAGITEELDEGSGTDRAWGEVVAGPELRSLLEQLTNPSEAAGIQPGVGLRAQLRPYQEAGVRWLYLLRHLRLGGCLADDMGLGKTIQVLDLLQQEHTDVSKPRKSTAKSGPDDPSLLLVPASLLGNWRQECEKFTPRLRMRFAHRSEGDEAILRALEDPKAPLPDCDVLVTTYNMVRRIQGIETRSWRMLILDEAQAIKNPGSLQTRAIKKLKAQSRLVMTGTPIENQIGDLWSLFDFCSPGLLGTQTAFKKTIQRLNKQEENAAYAAVRRLVRPYILRRLKTDPQIVPDLPEKTEVTTSCLLSRKQATLYKKVVTDLSQVLKSAEGIQRRGLVLGSLMQLKQICNHADHFLGGTAFSAEDSGKFQRLAELCEPIRERQERLLVFTQFQALTEPLAEYLRGLYGRPGLVLHGGTPVKRRKELVADFQAEDGPPFFVISVKAGGVGLNLTAASHVIHFDRWWNPAVENQATDRAFRIGQKRNVLVHKFVCRGTLEERIDQTLREKQTLSDNILNVDGQVLLTEMSNEQLLDFVSLDFNRAVESDA